jgi:hypothetical protein
MFFIFVFIITFVRSPNGRFLNPAAIGSSSYIIIIQHCKIYHIHTQLFSKKSCSCCAWHSRISSIACNAAAMLVTSKVLQLSNVLLCHAQQDITIQLDNKNNGRFKNPAAIGSSSYPALQNLFPEESCKKVCV